MTSQFKLVEFSYAYYLIARFPMEKHDFAIAKENPDKEWRVMQYFPDEQQDYDQRYADRMFKIIATSRMELRIPWIKKEGPLRDIAEETALKEFPIDATKSMLDGTPIDMNSKPRGIFLAGFRANKATFDRSQLREHMRYASSHLSSESSINRYIYSIDQKPGHLEIEMADQYTPATDSDGYIKITKEVFTEY